MAVKVSDRVSILRVAPVLSGREFRQYGTVCAVTGDSASVRWDARNDAETWRTRDLTIEGSARYLEDWDDQPHPCTSFDATWNGWDTPVVTLAQLRHLAARWDHVAAMGDPISRITFYRDRPVFHSNPDGADVEHFVMTPGADGLYHLAVLGFTFTAISPEWNGSEPDTEF